MLVFELPKEIVNRPEALGFSPDGRLLAVVCDGYVSVLDTVAGTVRELKTKYTQGFSQSCGIAFTPDGHWLTVPHSHRTPQVIEVHDIETGAVARSFALSHYADVCVPGPGGRLMYIALRSNNDSLKRIVQWNPLTDERFELIARKPFLVGELAVSGDEKWLATARDGTIRLWDMSGKKPLSRPEQQFQIANCNIFSLALSSDGAFVAAGCMFYGAPGAVHVGDVKTGEMWRAGEEPGNNSRGVAFHPSRPVLAMRGRSAGEVAFYDTAARIELRRYAWPLHEVSALAFSPDGLRCAAAGSSKLGGGETGPGKIVIWDVDV